MTINKKILSIGVFSWLIAATCAQAAPAATPASTAPASNTTTNSVIRLGDLTIPLFDGKSFAAKNYQGKYVVINFWATWCAPCLKEMPEFQKLADTRKDLQMLGLAYEDDTDANIQAVLQKRKISYLNGKVDVYNPLPAPLETPKGLPLTMVFDQKGVLLKKFLGPVTGKDILAVIDKK